jgi:ADP-ribose pyrophosphatase YjhB (NUDIX family)
VNAGAVAPRFARPRWRLRQTKLDVLTSRGKVPRFMSLSDWAHRVAYRYGYCAARLLWRFTKPRHVGAIAMLWHDKKVLLVRTSYQDFWGAPGGGIKLDEAPVQAAIREVSEEIGLQFTPEQLRHALAVEHFWDNDATRCKYPRCTYRMHQRSVSTIGKSSRHGFSLSRGPITKFASAPSRLFSDEGG